jgi:putative ABC transport system substrate-binding protein
MAAWPIATLAQNAQRMPRIGYLMDRSGPGLFDEGFLSGLREHGYEVGRNITVEYRWTEGKTERLPALANELVALKVDAIVTAGAQAVEVAKKATTTIPIVMTSSQDAVGDGLVASLARPGGNVTGRSVYAPELTQKRIELLKEVVPGLSRVAVLWNVQNAGGASRCGKLKRRVAPLASRSNLSTCEFQRVWRLVWREPRRAKPAPCLLSRIARP